MQRGPWQVFSKMMNATGRWIGTPRGEMKETPDKRSRGEDILSQMNIAYVWCKILVDKVCQDDGGAEGGGRRLDHTKMLNGRIGKGLGG